MQSNDLRSALEHLGLADGGLTDGQLLARFIDGREEAAFAALVRRHGPMVLGVCRRLLGNAQDAEDAFQASFLVLARKAPSILRREAVASFLYGVAYRTALRARVRAVKRRALERQVEDMPHPEVPPPEVQDWRPLLDRELSRLPEKYRAPLVLCDLEGKTRREAARQLGLVEGTLASRLATARRMLARRLVKCGLTLSGGALAMALGEGAASAVPPGLAIATVKAAAVVAAGQTAGVATPAAVLMNEVLRAMLMTKLKLYVAVAVVAVTVGAGGLAFRAAGQVPRAESRPLTEVELLRREVDILKLQMEVVQAELRKLKSQAAATHRTTRGQGPATSSFDPSVAAPDVSLPATEGTTTAVPGAPAGYGSISVAPAAPAPSVALPTRAPGGAVAPAEDVPQALPVSPDGGTAPTAAYPARVKSTAPTSRSPEEEAEAALKALREAGNDGDARRKAVDALEKALKRLKHQQGAPKNPFGR
jgi:RNA polymerase sigma factor (sigma-70 family)